jgi:hypothetical protein
MTAYKAPQDYPMGNNEEYVFLAGSIEMGKAVEWQTLIEKEFEGSGINTLNPRRDDWDSSWVQDPTPGTKFHEQVTWELTGLENSDMIVFYFDPKTQSPVTLLELGKCLENNEDKLIFVCCSPEYFRYGNVKIMCDREFERKSLILFSENFDDLVSDIRLALAFM